MSWVLQPLSFDIQSGADRTVEGSQMSVKVSCQSVKFSRLQLTRSSSIRTSSIGDGVGPGISYISMFTPRYSSPKRRQTVQMPA